MDQLKVSGQLTDNTKADAYLMTGTTTDQDLAMTRLFNNMDFRLTNTAIPNTSLTAYGTVFNEVETCANRGGRASDQPGGTRPSPKSRTAPSLGAAGSWSPSTITSTRPA